MVHVENQASTEPAFGARIFRSRSCGSGSGRSSSRAFPGATVRRTAPRRETSLSVFPLRRSAAGSTPYLKFKIIDLTPGVREALAQYGAGGIHSFEEVFGK